MEKKKRQIMVIIFNRPVRINNLDTKNINVVVEQVSAMPGQGVTSMLILVNLWSY